MRTGRPPRPLAVRLVEKIGEPDTNGCWPWLGRLNAEGYGIITVGGSDERVLRAHRVAYELLVDLVPEGLVLDHLCRNRACVNPLHLEPVTIGENVKRGGPSLKTHCIRGHELTTENTYKRKRGGRDCKLCGRERAALAYLRDRSGAVHERLVELEEEAA